MVLEIKQDEKGFMDFEPAVTRIGETCREHIESLLRHGGEVIWGEEDSEGGDCPGINTNRGSCEVRRVREKDGTVFVLWMDDNGNKKEWELSELLLNDLVALYEAVFHKVMQEKNVEADQEEDPETRYYKGHTTYLERHADQDSDGDSGNLYDDNAPDPGDYD